MSIGMILAIVVSASVLLIGGIRRAVCDWLIRRIVAGFFFSFFFQYRQYGFLKCFRGCLFAER